MSTMTGTDTFRFTDSDGVTWESYPATVRRAGQFVRVRRRRRVSP